MKARRLRLLTLTGSITGASVVALDGTVLTVAQPTLQRDLHASFAETQWTSTGYLIAVASLLVFAGRLGDRYGHRRVFAVGILGFGAASAAIGLAPGISWVIGLRVVQGACGALLQPATLGMLCAAYPPGLISRPLALRTAAIGAAAAVGPVVGGALTTHFGWRAVFFLSVLPAVVVGAAALAVRERYVTQEPLGGGPGGAGADRAQGAGRYREAGPVRDADRLRNAAGRYRDSDRSREADRSRIAGSRGWPGSTGGGARGGLGSGLDLPGACLLAAALGCLVHALVGLPATAPWLVAAGVCGAAFVRHERRAANPLLPPEVTGSRTVTAALSVLLAASAAMFGALFVGTYVLQEIQAMDPLRGSLTALPLAVAMVASATAVPALMRRHGPRRTTATAMAVLALGVLLLSRLTAPGAASWTVGGGFLLMGAGFGTVMVTATTVLVRRVPARHAGVAGGLQQTAMNTGPALGIAAATMLLTLAAPGTAGGRAPGAGGTGAGGTGAEAVGAFASAVGGTLTGLAAVAAAGALCALRLPVRDGTEAPVSPGPAAPAARR
ncbi:MFS transporter [Streptomyces sp. NRRL S-118]|uniref:MFS transporter n=1 Tax=Streptomyces sp. NRRL S-118 TaxID=1463881 RepID=UPI000587A955|nr:MFS transporter [Streptomyces sp. NRRL S-118]